MPSDAPLLAGARVLVVEDEFYLAADLADTLRQHGADVIGPAPTIEAAERLIEDDRPDCAILDMNLRGAPGAGLAERLKREGVGFMLLTGYAVSALPEDLRDAPYLEKPATAAAITKLVAQIVEQSRAPA